MSQHKTATLRVLFLDYTLRNSPTGQYYVFNVLNKDKEREICRMDSIHRSRVAWLFNALDSGEPKTAPVVRDIRGNGYRIDLGSINEFAPTEEASTSTDTSPKEKPKIPSKERVRIQLKIEPWKQERIQQIAEAEGYTNYSEWLRSLIDRVIEGKGGAK